MSSWDWVSATAYRLIPARVYRPLRPKRQKLATNGGSPTKDTAEETLGGSRGQGYSIADFGATSGETRHERRYWPLTNMLTSDKDMKRQAFHAAIKRARADGLAPEDMVSMITTDVDSQPLATPDNPADSADVIYDVLPDGMIDLPSAAKKYDISVKTLGMWVHRGKLPRRGRLRGKAAGGGYIVTDEAAIPLCRDNPRKPWHSKSVRP